jgi:type IV secretory pathway VirB3-like protein
MENIKHIVIEITSMKICSFVVVFLLIKFTFLGVILNSFFFLAKYTEKKDEVYNDIGILKQRTHEKRKILFILGIVTNNLFLLK